VEDHLRGTVCLVQLPPSNPPIGMSEDQGKQLRRRSLFVGLTKTQGWKRIYQILFPDEHELMIPNPCEYILILKVSM